MLKLMMIKLQAKRSKRDRMWVAVADNNKMIPSKVPTKITRCVEIVKIIDIKFPTL